MLNESVRNKIVEFIKENRVSTTEVADCLGKTGVLPKVLPLSPGQFSVGVVKWVYAYDESNWDVHEQLQNVEKGKVIFVESFNCGERAIFGELVSKYLLLYRQSQALVVKGLLRDAHRIIKEKYPVWCTGVTPIGCFNRKNEKEFDEQIKKSHREIYDGSIAVCDDSGVVIIPKEKMTEDFLEKLIFIEDQEDKWFECIDNRKWDTFRTVCRKEYLNDGK